MSTSRLTMHYCKIGCVHIFLGVDFLFVLGVHFEKFSIRWEKEHFVFLDHFLQTRLSCLLMTSHLLLIFLCDFEMIEV